MKHDVLHMKQRYNDGPMAHHNDVGRDGETVASEFLIGKGLQIVDRNWSVPYGEIDIVARGTDGLVHFIEVKTVSWETRNSVSHETNPVENVHPAKVRRLQKAIQSYIASRKIADEWQFDVISVRLDAENKIARVGWLQNVVLNS